MDILVAIRPDILDTPANLAAWDNIQTYEYEGYPMSGDLLSVAVIDGVVAGRLIAGLTDSRYNRRMPGQDFWVVEHVDVLAGYQRRGICKAIFKAALAYLRQHGYRDVRLTNVGEIAGCRCYIRGGQEVGAEVEVGQYLGGYRFIGFELGDLDRDCAEPPAEQRMVFDLGTPKGRRGDEDDEGPAAKRKTSGMVPWAIGGLLSGVVAALWTGQ